MSQARRTRHFCAKRETSVNRETREEKKIKLYLKLCKANKCLYFIRCLRKEGCSQAEVDHLFSSIVLPNIAYTLSVYGASEAELTIA